LLNAIVTVVDSENLFAAKNSNADCEDVLADKHVSAMELATHRELAAAHVRHEENS
jgi:hypothetical protein